MPTNGRIRRSVRQERRIARDVGGRRVAGSGSMPGNKGDVAAPGYLLEAKYTDKASYSLKLAIWRKIECEAIRAGCEPGLIIEIMGRRLIVLDYNAWRGLISESRQELAEKGQEEV